MSAFRPFRSRIVKQDRAADVVTPMVDSLEVPNPDLRTGVVDPAAYAESGAALYVYRQSIGTRSHTGVVCDIGADAFVNGQVRAHESVQPDRVEALVRHFATTPDRPALVALLHRAGPVFSRTVADTCRTPPLLAFSGPDGREQTVWRVAAGPDTEALSAELSGAGHYIADGHHRVAASLEEWRAAGQPAGTGLVCVVYPMDGLHLFAFHRRVTGPVDPADLLALLESGCEVRQAAGQPALGTGSVGVYTGGEWLTATFRDADRDGSSDLDVALLQAHVLEGLVGPGHAIEIASARTSVGELTQRCDEDGGALFVLAPPSLDVLTGLADRGEVMPPKTTYFDPKPYAGIFLPS